MSENSIARGTDPLLNFILPFHTEEVTNFAFTVKQAEKTEPVIDKGLKDCTLASYTASVRLTQKDTLKLAPGKAYFQVRVSAAGRAYSSPVFTVAVQDALKEAEI